MDKKTEKILDGINPFQYTIYLLIASPSIIIFDDRLENYAIVILIFYLSHIIIYTKTYSRHHKISFFMGIKRQVVEIISPLKSLLFFLVTSIFWKMFFHIASSTVVVTFVICYLLYIFTYYKTYGSLNGISFFASVKKDFDDLNLNLLNTVLFLLLLSPFIFIIFISLSE